jgi:hypothetical protein
VRWGLAGVLLSLPTFAEDSPLPTLRVAEEGWGDVDHDNVAAVLKSAAAELAKHVPERRTDVLQVAYSADGPIVYYDRGPNGEYQIRLQVQGRYWSQFAYQFAHEHCHVLCRYRKGENPNKWFEESLCELASIFVVEKMAETWRTDPPYRNWRDYSQSLSDYVKKHVENKGLPEGETLADWYRKNEPELRKTATDRERNQVVALALLPKFRDQPKRWTTVQHVNAEIGPPDMSFRDYLHRWQKHAPEEHREFIGDICAEFGLPRTP